MLHAAADQSKPGNLSSLSALGCALLGQLVPSCIERKKFADPDTPVRLEHTLSPVYPPACSIGTTRRPATYCTSNTARVQQQHLQHELFFRRMHATANLQEI